MKDIELWKGDCIELMKNIPDKSIDMVLTDPPYELGIFKEGCGGTLNNLGKFDKSLIPVNKISHNKFDLELFCSEAIRVMKDINIYIWCNKKQIVKYFNFFVNNYNCLYDILVWNKTNALPSYSNKYLTDCEYCLYFHNSGHCFPKNYNDAKTVYTSPINRENKKYNHPTIKPLDFISSMIRNSSKEGDVILDPFMGSGTTGVACKMLGRKFIGIEIDDEYFDIAKQRIENGFVQEKISNEELDNLPIFQI